MFTLPQRAAHISKIVFIPKLAFTLTSALFLKHNQNFAILHSRSHAVGFGANVDCSGSYLHTAAVSVFFDWLKLEHLDPLYVQADPSGRHWFNF